MTMTSQFELERPSDRANHRTSSGEPHLATQILSIIAFGIFSIVAVSLAFAATWIAGMVLAILFAVTWSRSRIFGGRDPSANIAQQVVAEVAPAFSKTSSSGNASFDAYKADTIRRLQEEQESFEGFLNRLREAKDKTEFDEFMDERARNAQAQRDTADS